MSEIVPADQIEGLVGIERHAIHHYARVNSDEQIFYVLHSKSCLSLERPITQCGFTYALDRGIDEYLWSDFMDTPVRVRVRGGDLLPYEVPE